MKAQLWVGVAAWLGLSAVANAAVAWSTPSGSQSAFTYANGQSINGKFGDGTSTPTGFVLSPNQFVASANQENTPVSTSDTASVIVHLNGPLVAVQVMFLGDYTIFGTGSVDAVGTLTLTDLGSLATISVPVNINGVPASTSSTANGTFTGWGLAQLPPPTGTDVRIDLTANVTATAGANSTALIELKDADLTLFLFPEPTSLATLGLAYTVLARRARS